MKMIIGGQHVDATDGKTIEVHNPSTGELLDTVPAATEGDVLNMLQIAREGKRIWAAKTVEERCEILLHAAELLKEATDTLADQVCREQGKIRSIALEEVEKLPVLFRGYAEKARHAYGEVLPDNGSDMIVVRREPLGVIACVVPFNFPAELFAHKVAPALAAGNAVVVKPSSDTPLIDITLCELLHKAGVPGEVLQIVTGSGAKIGKLLSSSDLIDGISLTGSTEVGIDIMQEAASNLKKVFLELGGNDAMVVFEDADIEDAANEAVNARIYNSGQVCCSTKRCIVQNSIREAFAKHVVEKMKTVQVGNAADAEVDMGPLINKRAAKLAEQQVAEVVSQGASLLCGGHSFNETYFEPTVLNDVQPDMDIARDLEVFAPVVAIIGFDTEEQAVSIANSSSYGLSGGVMTKDIHRGMRVALAMDTGGVIVGGSGMYRTCDMPFGGHKKSGIGHEGFFDTLDEMIKTKNIVLKGILGNS